MHSCERFRFRTMFASGTVFEQAESEDLKKITNAIVAFVNSEIIELLNLLQHKSDYCLAPLDLLKKTCERNKFGV